MEQKTLSAGIVVLHRESGNCRYLLLRSYRYWDFPKGMVEAEEEPFVAACREVREEAGLDDLDFAWGQQYCETLPYGAGKVARYYAALSRAGKARLPPNPELGCAEHQEFLWLPYGDACSLLPLRLLPVIDWAHVLTGC